MKFKLTTAGYFYKKENAESLGKLGIKFIESGQGTGIKGIFTVTQEDTYIEINTIEELVALTEEYGDIVFDGEEIEIYDDYRE